MWLISLGHVHYFHRGIQFFTPSQPVHHLHTRLQFISCDFQCFCPSPPKPPPSNCPKRKRLCGEEGNFLKCLIFLRVRGMVNLRNDLSVSPDDSMQLWNKLETVSMREKGGGRGWGGDNVCLCQLFHFFLSLSFSFFLLFEVSRHYFRLVVQKWGHVAQPHPLTQNTPSGVLPGSCRDCTLVNKVARKSK